jgi:uncharacterized membrane protein YbhN (UPF0104 family)
VSGSRLLHLSVARIALVVAVLASAILLLLWRFDVNIVRHAFELVVWKWVVLAVLLNLLSVLVRSIAWEVVIDEAVTPPKPRSRDVFAAFSVGLLGNAALPGRVGEVSRIVVLTRRMRGRPGLWATLTGTVFAHRLFDVVAASALVVYVVYAARIPQWARPALAIALGIGFGLLIAGLLLARRPNRGNLDDVGPVRRVLRLARYGLTVFKRPLRAAAALFFQLLGWGTQLLAVWTMFYAFDIEGTITMAALVLVIMNLVIVFPLWPGNVGLVQAAIALSLLPYGVGYARGFAYGIGLQAVEVSVGVALGFVFLAREGFSFAMLRRMPEVTDLEVDERVERIA